ncbi:unnamed protein product [Dibothriocephalus latus]|uniref:Uncharacterized protein n=1 Tax=Dibothriocephalus latus TaxID=60516 RepID=A0A3P7PDA7_DIBLA|nr:unnamed protein product [Dibothriocephalus latus]
MQSVDREGDIERIAGGMVRRVQNSTVLHLDPKAIIYPLPIASLWAIGNNGLHLFPHPKELMLVLRLFHRLGM